MKKLKAVIGVLFISGFFSGIAGGTVHFKCAKLPLALMVGSIVFMILTSLGLSIINEREVDRK